MREKRQIINFKKKNYVEKLECGKYVDFLVENQYWISILQSIAEWIWVTRLLVSFFGADNFGGENLSLN
jgi:hypothetical protein